jgi:phospholipase/carboxylesterase
MIRIAALDWGSYYLEIRRLGRRQFLLQFCAILSTTLLLKACKRDSSSAMAPTKSSLGDQFLSLNFISVPPAKGQTPVGLVVCLHGFTGNSQQLAPFAPMFALPEYQFLFPDAPYSHPYGGRMWYNLQSRDDQGLTASRQQLTDWLKSLESRTGVPLSRTVLAGFSQGGAMALEVGLTLPLAGLMCMSGYLHSQPKPMQGKSFPPVLIVHGRQDQMVPLSSAQSAREALKAVGVRVEYQEFDMGHIVIPAVFGVMRNFVMDSVQASQVRH